MTKSIEEVLEQLTNEGHAEPPKDDREAARRLVQAFARRQKARKP